MRRSVGESVVLAESMAWRYRSSAWSYLPAARMLVAALINVVVQASVPSNRMRSASSMDRCTIHWLSSCRPCER